MAKYVYESGRLTLEYGASGALAHRYLWSSAVDEVLADEQIGSQVLWPLADHEGTVRDLVNSNGTVLNHREYDSFGRLTAESNPAVDHLFAYTGQYLDEETDLQNHHNRWYDPAAGRWISEDPLSFAGGDANLYRYSGNSPTNYVDPSGLSFWNECKEAMGYIAPITMVIFPPLGGVVSLGMQALGAGLVGYQIAGMLGGHRDHSASNSGSTNEVAPSDSPQAWEGNSSTLDMFAMWTDPASGGPQPVIRGQNSASGGGIPASQASYLARAGVQLDQFVGQLNTLFWTGTWVAPDATSGLAAAGDFARGLGTGGKAIVNQGSKAITSTATLGFYESKDLIGVNDWDRAMGYDASAAVARAGSEILVGVGTGGAASALSKGGQTARVGSYALRGMDAMQNAAEMGRGGVSIARNGLTWQNGLQVVGGGLGMAGDFADVLPAMQRGAVSWSPGNRSFGLAELASGSR